MKLAPLLVVALVPMLAAAAPAPEAGPKPKTNILVIMVDDLDVSVWETSLALGYLPRIRSDLIDKGTTFRNAFVSESLCCPSRVTYLTGQYAHNHGVIRNSGKHGGFHAFAHDESTIGVWLREAGYRTGLVGKYLNGYADTAYVAPGWDTWNAVVGHLEFDYDMSVNGALRHYGHDDGNYEVDVLAGLAVQFVETADSRPFFLTVTPVVPHYEDVENDEYDAGTTVRPAPRYADTPALPAIPPEALVSYNEADMSDKPLWMHTIKFQDVEVQRAGYNSKIAALRAVDDLVGDLVDALARRGKLATTQIVFTSDNGFQYGTHRRGDKIDFYEESARIPAIVRDPGQDKPRISDEWITNVDWAATIVDIAGALPDRVLDGRSLLDLSRGRPGRRTLLTEYAYDPVGFHPAFAAVRSKDPSLVGPLPWPDTIVYAETYDSNGALTDRELYDIDLDPQQLASAHASTAPFRIGQMAALAARLAALKRCAGDECRRLED